MSYKHLNLNNFYMIGPYLKQIKSRESDIIGQNFYNSGQNYDILVLARITHLLIMKTTVIYSYWN